MDFLHSQLHLKIGDVVEVHCDHPCTILVMNEVDFQLYQRGQKHNYHNGGYFEVLPARIVAPSDGIWHITIDAGHATPAMKYNIRIYPVG